MDRLGAVAFDVSRTVPECLPLPRCQVGESPLWHPDEACLYWVDIPAARLLRFSPSTGRHEIFAMGAEVGGFTIEADGSLLLFMARGAIRRWRGGDFLETILEEIADERETRFNDVIADPAGRVYCGTLPVVDTAGRRKRGGRLYRLDPDRRLAVLLEDQGAPNGMGFSPDRQRLYFSDSAAGIQTIFVFDYDLPSGVIANGRTFLQAPLDLSEGRPDGMTVDGDGCVWSARVDGWMVVRTAPDGQLLERIRLPARKVTSLTFGGPEYGDLYITTAAGAGEGAGALFRLRPGVSGVPEFRSRIGA